MKYECSDCGNRFNEFDSEEGERACPFCGETWGKESEKSEKTSQITHTVPYWREREKVVPYWKRYKNRLPKRPKIWDEEMYNTFMNTSDSGTSTYSELFSIEIEEEEEDEGEFFRQR